MLLQRLYEADLNINKRRKPTDIILMHIRKYYVIIKINYPEQ